MSKRVPEPLAPDKVTKALKDTYEKENLIRINWYIQHKDAIRKRILNREPKYYSERDIATYVIAAELDLNKQDNIIYRENRLKNQKIPLDAVPKGIQSLKHGHSIVNLGLGDPKEDPKLDRPETDLTLDPIMRPVDPELKKAMDDPKDIFGRVNYLKKRSENQPENRYYFPECVNWDYGWRLKYSVKGESRKFGRQTQLTKHYADIHQTKEKRARRQLVFTKVNAGK